MKKFLLCVLLAASAFSAFGQNVKTSAMPAGAPAQATDLVPVARAGTNVSLQVSDILAEAHSGAFVSQTYNSCADTSGSGTAQVCNTAPVFTVVAGSCVNYTTTTANTGAGLTVNINSLGAKSVAKWQTTTTLFANDIRANTQVTLCYDGTNLELNTVGNTPATSATPAGTTGEPQVANVGATALAASLTPIDCTQFSSTATIPANSCASGEGAHAPLTNDDAGKLQACACAAQPGSYLQYCASSYIFGSNPFADPASASGGRINKKLHYQFCGGTATQTGGQFNIPPNTEVVGPTPTGGVGSDPNNYQFEVDWSQGNQSYVTGTGASWTPALACIGPSDNEGTTDVCHGPSTGNSNTTASGETIRNIRFNCLGAANVSGLVDNGGQEFFTMSGVSVTGCLNDNSGITGTITSMTGTGTITIVTSAALTGIGVGNDIYLTSTGTTACNGGPFTLTAANNSTFHYSFINPNTTCTGSTGTARWGSLTTAVALGNGGAPYGTNSGQNSSENEGPLQFQVFGGPNTTWTAIPVLINDAQIKANAHITVNLHGGGGSPTSEPCVLMHVGGNALQVDAHLQGINNGVSVTPCDSTGSGFAQYGVQLGSYQNAGGDFGPFSCTSDIQTCIHRVAGSVNTVTGTIQGGSFCQNGCVTNLLRDDSVSPSYTIGPSVAMAPYHMNGFTAAGGAFGVTETTFTCTLASCPSGTIAAALQYAIPYYGVTGTNPGIQGLSGPTTLNGVPQFLTETAAGGMAATPAFLPAGVATRASTCGSNVDTVLLTDRFNVVTWNDASACAVTLPQAGSTNFAAGFGFLGCNIGAGTATVTPTTSTISYTNGSSYTSAASSVAVAQGQCLKVTTDSSGSNYFGQLATGGTGGGSVFPVTVSGTVTSGGIPYFSTTTNEATSALLASNAIVQGGGAGGAPTTGNGDFTVDATAHTFKSGASGLVDFSAITGANGLLLPAGAAGTMLNGTVTANLSAPIVLKNGNSSNNNTSIGVGITTPGSSTGQTTLNINGATTGGDLTDWGTGGTWTSGVLSGQTNVAKVGITGAFTGLSFTSSGTTAGFIDLPQGTTSSGVAPCNTLSSICIQAPTAVTSQVRVLAGSPATGFSLFTNSSGTMTETISATSGTLTSGVGLWGTSAINTVLASTVANVAGHFTNLQVVTALGGTCSTLPVFNVFDGTTNTGSTVTASASTQTKGTGSSTAQTQTFAAGDVIGIYISTAGGTCTTDQFTITAQYSIP